jgi:signal transduction histidine kinase
MYISTALIHAGSSVGGSSIIILLAIIAAVVLLQVVLFTSWNKRRKRREQETETALKKRTLELMGTIQGLELSHKVMQQQAEFQKKIIAAIVHGIKSPLKYLTLTGKQLYNMSEGEASLRDVLRSMYTSSHHMYTFTDNLLQYVKLYLQEHQPILNTFNLYELVNEKVLMFKDIANSKGDIIYNHIHPQMLIHTDRQLLSIVVHNLLDNAVKYTANGMITLSAFIVERRMHLAVQDTGIGMDEAILSRPPAFSTAEPGLGLVITKQLLAMINGKLEIKSRPGAGTTVILIFEQSAEMF